MFNSPEVDKKAKEIPEKGLEIHIQGTFDTGVARFMGRGITLSHKDGDSGFEGLLYSELEKLDLWDIGYNTYLSDIEIDIKLKVRRIE